MLQAIMKMIEDIQMQSDGYRLRQEKIAEEQKKEFSKQCPLLEAKRQEAIKYLGDKWILAKKQERLSSPRRI